MGCEFEQSLQGLAVGDPDQGPRPFLPLQLGRLSDDLPRAGLVLVERVGRGDLDALPEGGVGVLHEEGAVEAVPTEKTVPQLAGGVTRAGQGGEVAGTVARGVDEVEGTVAEEVERVVKGTQGFPFFR